MNFFEQQDSSRRKSKQLILLFVLAVLSIILAMYFLVVAVTAYTEFSAQSMVDGPGPFGPGWWWKPELFLATAVGGVIVIGLGSLYKLQSLSGGGHVVAELMGGVHVPPDTKISAQRKLYNVVEEMALASGVVVPEVYLLGDEKSINAFAAGHSPDDAAIGVTMGCVDKLSRDELQGVIAHEFSHILNGDMKMNIRMMGVLHGIMFVTLAGRLVMRGMFYSSLGRRRSGHPALIVLALALIVIGYVGVLFGKLIQAAISRQREYLADASAVQFTRNPEGIAGALKKIGGFELGSQLSDANAQEVSHMTFSNALSQSFTSIFATHPPLEKRIQRLDAAFAGEMKGRAAGAGEPLAAGVSGFSGGAFGSALNAGEVVNRVGSLSPEGIAFAGTLLKRIPKDVSDCMHEPYGARAVVYAVLLDEDQGVRGAQLGYLKNNADPKVFPHTQNIYRSVLSLGAQSRLPLLDLALPALKELSKGQYTDFSKNIKALILADKKVTLFEFALSRILSQHLGVHFGTRKNKQVTQRSLSPLRNDCAMLLSVLAHAGHDDATQAQRAFKAGHKVLFAREPEMLSEDQCGLNHLHLALDRLAGLSPSLKKELIRAAATTALHDQKITTEEMEMLRATGAMLDCPIPPLQA